MRIPRLLWVSPSIISIIPAKEGGWLTLDNESEVSSFSSDIRDKGISVLVYDLA